MGNFAFKKLPYLVFVCLDQIGESLASSHITAFADVHEIRKPSNVHRLQS